MHKVTETHMTPAPTFYTNSHFQDFFSTRCFSQSNGVLEQFFAPFTSRQKLLFASNEILQCFLARLRLFVSSENRRGQTLKTCRHNFTPDVNAAFIQELTYYQDFYAFPSKKFVHFSTNHRGSEQAENRQAGSDFSHKQSFAEFLLNPLFLPV